MESSKLNEEKTGLTTRAFLIGLVLVILWNILWGLRAGFSAGNHIETATYPGAYSILLLTIFYIISRALGDKLKKGEFTIIYAMLLSSIGIGYYWGFYIDGGFIYQAALNPSSYVRDNWPEFIGIMVPSNLEVMQGMILGGSVVPWSEWTMPILWVMMHIGSFILMTSFFGLIVSPSLILTERIPFPMLSVTKTIIEKESYTGFEGKTILSGFLLAFLIQLFLGPLSHIDPSLPAFSAGVDLAPTLYTMLPGAVASLSYNPVLIYMFMLAPTDILLSTTIFTLIFWWIIPPIEVTSGILPLHPNHASLFFHVYARRGTIASPMGFQIETFLVAGASIGLVIGFIALYRRSIWAMFKASVSGEKIQGLSSRVIVIGFIVSMIAFMYSQVLLQIPWLVSLFTAALFIVYTFFALRLRGEAIGIPSGAGYSSIRFQEILTPLSLRRYIGVGTAGCFNYYEVPNFWGSLGFHVGPSAVGMVEGLSLATETNVKWKSVVIATIVSSIVAVFVGFTLFIWGAYTYGFNVRWKAMMDQIGWTSRLNAWMANLDTMLWGTAESMRLTELIGGAALSIILLFLKLRFPALPVNPMGLAMAGIWQVCMGGAWFAMFIAFIIKTAVIKTLGVKWFQEKLVPLISGLMLGWAACTFFDAIILVIK